MRCRVVLFAIRLPVRRGDAGLRHRVGDGPGSAASRSVLSTSVARATASAGVRVTGSAGATAGADESPPAQRGRGKVRFGAHR